MPEVRTHFTDVSRELRHPQISPTGVRALFEAHGEILTVPASLHGDPRNLTNTPGVMERAPAWAPDGQQIAYFSDESGEYALHLEAQNGEGAVKKIPLAGGSSFYFDPVWSPDSKLICFYDNQINIWYLDTQSGKLARIDANAQKDIDHEMAWSPDSKWIAYTKSLPNMLDQVLVYSIESGHSTAVGDGMSDAHSPAFDRDGRYLFFLASTNMAETRSHLDMSSDLYQATSNVYAAVLQAGWHSPVQPESDEEKLPGAKGGSPSDSLPHAAVHIDLDNLQNRIVALPIPAANYGGMQAEQARETLPDRQTPSP